MEEPHIWYVRIKVLKEERNYVMRDLVEGIGVSETAINNWKFKEIKSEHLMAAANFFQVSADYLLGLTDDREISNRYPEVTENQRRLIRYVESLDLSERQYSMIAQVIENTLQFHLKEDEH